MKQKLILTNKQIEKINQRIIEATVRLSLTKEGNSKKLKDLLLTESEYITKVLLAPINSDNIIEGNGDMKRDWEKLKESISEFKKVYGKLKKRL